MDAVTGLEDEPGERTRSEQASSSTATLFSAFAQPVQRTLEQRARRWHAGLPVRTSLGAQEELIGVLDWPLLTGPAPIALSASAFAAAMWLLHATFRRRRLRVVIAVICACLLTAAMVTVAVAFLARNVWMLFPDRLDPAVSVWAGAGLSAVVVAGVHALTGRSLRRAVVSLTAALVIVAACANQINGAFGAYLTLRDALGISQTDQVPFPVDRAGLRLLPDVDPTESRWSPPVGLASRGILTSTPIPGLRSGFAARDAKIYLPPAYFSDPRPQLPVLVLLPGQPGTPQDWLGAGRLVRIMDAFAADRRGLTPVVVVVDGTGTQFGDPLCVDSRRGNADTYLALDVPAWIKTHLTVDTDPQGWAIGGLSYGGTCALQLSTNHPDVYPTFLDISGQSEPSLGDRQRTIAEAFGGDQRAFNRVNPLELLRARRYPGSAAAIVVGAADRDAKSDARTVYMAVRAAGMNAHYTELPGAHNWQTFSAALAHELPWLAQRIGLTK